MIPLRDVIPSRTTPYITITIIALNAVAWFYEITLPQHDLDVFLQTFGVVPASFSAPTLITSMFLHGSWMHVIGNMWYLWIFGDNVEDRVGHGRFVVFYLLCGVAAALSMALIDPASRIPMVGASGAISGILAAYVLIYPRVRVTVIVPLGIIFYPFAISAVWVVGFWFVLQLISALLTQPGQPGVAFWAHVGGFGAGAALTPLFKSGDVPYFGGKARRGPWG